ncbi:hypothetical protein LR948_18075 [Roseivivax sp. GX 12232]|uniref:helix-turn-helix domain-containing protein n=1 Tax=Roseivivax sp. GX 12232 TaxID=2900547 RepID=UPI001E5774B6|nr:helix-turn-helix domain-containing protein [Roseivivax sp. GX 12232]MCE0507276.1 hypothetical protein [Roseivivax sp. GX 12232]
MTQSIDEILAGLPARTTACAQTTKFDTPALPHPADRSTARGVDRGQQDGQDIFPPVQNRYQVLDLLDEVRSYIKPKITDSAMAVLKAHLSVLPEGPITHDMLLISYAKTETIQRRAKISCPRTRHRCEQRLAGVGVIELKRSNNCKRRPSQKRRSQVVDAYGVDLRPLFRRLPEFQKLKQEIELEEEAKQNIADEIKHQICELQQTACELFGSLPKRLSEFVRLVANALRRVSLTSSDMGKLKEAIEDECSALFVHEEPQEMAPAPDELTAGNDAESKTSQEHILADKTSVPGGQNVRHKESSKTNTESCARLSDAQRTFTQVWHSCSSIVSMYEHPPSSSKSLAGVILEFSGFLGLRHNQALTTLQAWGPCNMLLALDYIASRIDRIAQPAGYLSSMLRKWRNGEPVAAGRIRPGKF